MTYLSCLVVHIAVCKDGIEVFDALFGRMVIMMFKALFDGTKVHWMLDDLMVVGNIKFDGIYWCLKRPTELMFPHCFHHYIS